jgi:hypothetical protein
MADDVRGRMNESGQRVSNKCSLWGCFGNGMAIPPKFYVCGHIRTLDNLPFTKDPFQCS